MADSQQLTDLKELIQNLTDKLSESKINLENINEDKLKVFAEEANRIREKIALLQEETKLEQAIFNDYQSRGLLLDNELKRAKQKASYDRETARLAFKAIQDARERGEIDDKALETAKRQYETEMRINLARQRAIDLQEKNVKLGKEFATKLGGTFKENKFVNFLSDPGTFFKSFKANFNVFAAFSNGLNAVADGALNSIYSLLKKSFMAALELDNSIVGFRKNTQILDISVEESIRTSSLELMKFGITSEQVAKSYSQLYEANTRFGEYSKDQKKEIADQISLYGKLGYSAETLVDQFTFLTNVYGMSDDAALNAQKATLKYGRSIGLTGQQTTKAVQATKNFSAALGDSTGRELGKMMKVMKETNLEMGTLVKLADKFDTFESAADTVGRLNSILGGPYLNAIQMIENVNPADRINSVRTALMEAGKSFESMEYYEKKSIASAIGLETEDLALLMAGRQDLIEGLDFTQTTEDIINSREQMNKFIGVVEKLKSIGMSLIIPFSGVVDAIREMIDELEKTGAISNFAKEMKKIADSSEFRETLTSITKSVIEIIKYLPGFMKAISGVIEQIVKHPYLFGFLYTGAKIGAVGAQVMAARSMVAAAAGGGEAAAAAGGAGLLARLSGFLPTIGTRVAPLLPSAGMLVKGAGIGGAIVNAGYDMYTAATGGGVSGLIGGGIGGIAGAFLGGPVGAAMGYSLGSMAGKFIGSFFEEETNKTKAVAETQEAATANLNNVNQQTEKAKSENLIPLEQRININFVIDGDVLARSVVKIPAGRDYKDSPLVATITNLTTRGATTS